MGIAEPGGGTRQMAGQIRHHARGHGVGNEAGVTSRRVPESMDPAVLRANDVVQLVAEPLAPVVIRAAEVVVDAELAGDRAGEIEQADRLVEYEGGHERIRCTCANIKRAGPRDVVGTQLSFPRRRDDVLGDINPVVGISAVGVHERIRRSESVRSRHLPRPNGQVIPGSADEGVASLDFRDVVQQDTAQSCRVGKSCSNVWRRKKRLRVSSVRHAQPVMSAMLPGCVATASTLRALSFAGNASMARWL